jgi:hypothetical protein
VRSRYKVLCNIGLTKIGGFDGDQYEMLFSRRMSRFPNNMLLQFHGRDLKIRIFYGKDEYRKIFAILQVNIDYKAAIFNPIVSISFFRFATRSVINYRLLLGFLHRRHIDEHCLRGIRRTTKSRSRFSQKACFELKESTLVCRL